MAKVLVTGATGFIGTKLTEQLIARGDDVICLVRETSNLTALDSLGVRYVFGDVRDKESIRTAMRGVETVYHLAGLATAFRLRDLMQVNYEGFHNIVTACAACGTPPVLVSVSSLAAAGPSPPGQIRTEFDPPRPVSNYGKAKRAAEQLAEQFAHQVPITIVRPPIVFGQGDLQMRSIFKSIFRYGVHLALGVAGSRYSLIHVDDLVAAMIGCSHRGARLVDRRKTAEAVHPPQGYYFVASEEQPTFAELGLLIGQSLGRTSVRILRSYSTLTLWPAAFVAETIARFRGQPFIFNFDKAREASAGNWVCSASMLRDELGITPAASVLERLRQTAQWYQQKNLL